MVRKWKVRQMDAGDVGEVLAIQRASQEAAQWNAADYEQAEARDTHCWVAEEGGRIGGFLSGRAAHDQFEILNLAVRADSRRQGVATLLLNEALSFARGSTREVFLEVRASNPARDFYRGHGFAERGRRARYYANPAEDALILSRRVG